MGGRTFNLLMRSMATARPSASASSDAGSDRDGAGGAAAVGALDEALAPGEDDSAAAVGGGASSFD